MFFLKKVAMATSLAISVLLLSSCSNKEVVTKLYLLLEGQLNLIAPERGIFQEYTVKSNGQWEVIRKSVQTWAEARPSSGQNDGSFRITLAENRSGNNRSMQFVFLLNGKELSEKISIICIMRKSSRISSPDLLWKPKRGINFPPRACMCRIIF